MGAGVLLSSPLADCACITPKELVTLAERGLKTVRDLLYTLPRRYEDRRVFDCYDGLSSAGAVCLRCRVRDVKFLAWDKRTRRPAHVRAEVEDMQSLGAPTFYLTWFNAPYMYGKLCAGQELVVYGRIKEFGKKLCITHPEYEVIRAGEDNSIHLNRIVPVYTAVKGINTRRLREIVRGILNELSPAPEPEVYEFVPGMPCKTALCSLHFPESAEECEKARRRFALEECVGQQLNVAWRRRRAESVPGLQTANTSYLVQDLAASLPFELTEAQKRCVREIYRDMKSPRSMNRLLQGDVGSGKTLVAMCAMLLAVENGYSAVMMAPTQILAEQHYMKFRQMLDKLDVPVTLITAEKKEESHLNFSKGQGGIVIGTHALLYGKKVPENLGLVVIDEQHKFGVNQREKLIAQQVRPDVLVMTATPIPRTLTLTFYGDLDVSVLDAAPAGRGRVITAVRTDKDKRKVVEFIKLQLMEGRQIYVVSPLIEGDENRKGKDVMSELTVWKKLLPGYEIGLLHGKLSADEKEAVMRDFRDNNISLLIATTVVEVGVDVPNATVMLINNAENFGLSQLHQLRGRIGRGGHKSYCILMTDAKADDERREKLNIVATTENGFELAEQDLKLRGPGDVLGTTQSGRKEVMFPEWLMDARLIHRAGEIAATILNEDPTLSSPKYRPLRHLIEDAPLRNPGN